MSSKTVTLLLVEDDDVDAEAVARGLRKHYIANPVVRAKDGVEALDILRGKNGKKKLPSPYMILVDLNLPRMDGISLIKTLRDDPRLQKSLIFVLTTSKSEEDKCAAYKQNVAGYLLKSNVGHDFMQMAKMLDYYWQIVEFPSV